MGARRAVARNGLGAGMRAREGAEGGWSRAACADDEQASDGEVDEEEEEVSVVVEADAVVYPRAVVIHLHHAPAREWMVCMCAACGRRRGCVRATAPVADGAVVRALRLGHVTLPAEAVAPMAVGGLAGLEVLECLKVVARVAGAGEDACPVVEEDVKKDVDAEDHDQPRREPAASWQQIQRAQRRQIHVRHQPDEPIGCDDEERADDAEEVGEAAVGEEDAQVASTLPRAHARSARERSIAPTSGLISGRR